MSKVKIIYQCQACGNTSPKWMGKCPDCGGWNSFVEEKVTSSKRQTSELDSIGTSVPMPLSEVEAISEKRVATGVGEFDRVLGGGIVQGSVTLIGGDPGIGKSTLILQIFAGLSKRSGRLLYVSGEESPQQIKMRADRLQTYIIIIVEVIESDHIVSHRDQSLRKMETDKPGSPCDQHLSFRQKTSGRYQNLPLTIEPL